jgi:hypothetical protein
MSHAEWIADELSLKLGVLVSPRTVHKSLRCTRGASGASSQRWATFVRNHAQPASGHGHRLPREHRVTSRSVLEGLHIMTVLLGGKNRTLAEFSVLAEHAELDLIASIADVTEAGCTSSTHPSRDRAAAP